MRLQKIMVVAVVLALLTALAAGLSVLNTRSSVESPTWTMISRFVVVLVFGSFGLAVARESQLQGSVFISDAAVRSCRVRHKLQPAQGEQVAPEREAGSICAVAALAC